MSEITINNGSAGEATAIVTRINGLGDRVQNAILSGRLVEARTLALAMLTAIAIIPDGEKEGEAGAKLSWDRNAIQGLIKQIGEVEGQTRTLSVETSLLHYDSITGCDDGCSSSSRRRKRGRGVRDTRKSDDLEEFDCC